METKELLNELFAVVRSRGQRAIAYSNEEKVRLELLELLEVITKMEVQIHQSTSTNISKVFLSKEDANTKDDTLEEDIVAQLAPVSEIIKS